MRALILQPPIAQFNTAYPSGAYLSAFLKNQNIATRWLDLNIDLFDEIFSKRGLEKLFSVCATDALALADSAERSGDAATAFNVRRYVSQRTMWCDWIDRITAMLRNEPGRSGAEDAHRFVFGAHVPRGSRMERCLAQLGRSLSTDDARALASCALADLADFITVAFDGNFSLVRYAESLATDGSDFAAVASGADSPVMRTFFVPLLERLFPSLQEKTLVLISVPFAGTFAPALCAGQFFKKRFGENTFVVLGGGFVNTELRETREAGLARYCDALCYDRGYGSYRQLLGEIAHGGFGSLFRKQESIYKMVRFTGAGIVEMKPSDDETLAFEKKTTAETIPDFSDIDFSRYPRLIDDKNPMHRLWSEGAWIKVYMAHGCYWHKCSFCDVTLDYVRGYCPTDVKRLSAGILRQCEAKGVFGVHFVDEAMPPALMVSFARENSAHGSPITWWGNVRFEKSFTRDVADCLAAGGLIGVSAGLESATGNGLSAIHKGTSLASIVGACCAFKEAGILVHAYMIYGYWWETPQDVINSMETLRQFYAHGLLDSCFWHKFVLTRHSRAYQEWKEGRVPGLRPKKRNGAAFAGSTLHFEGERTSEKYGAALVCALEQWMRGESLDVPVQKWFAFPVPRPTVPKRLIEEMVLSYEKARDAAFSAPVPSDASRKIWLGGEKIPLPGGKVGWFYMGERHEADGDADESVFRGKGLCVL